MNYARAIYRTLSQIPELEGRIYQGMLPQEPLPDWPAARFTLSGEPLLDICGTDDGSTDDMSVQIDLFASDTNFDSPPRSGIQQLDYLKARVIAEMESIVVAVDEVPLPAARTFDQYFFDSDAKVHRMLINFTLYPSSP